LPRQRCAWWFARHETGEMSDDATASVRTSSASIGIAVVAVMTTIRCVLFVLALLIQIDGFSATWARDFSPIPLLPIDVSAGVLEAVLLIVLLVLSLLSLWGLVSRREWGWTLSIITAGVTLTLNLGWWANGDPRYVSMLVNSIAVFYLNQRDLRAVFKVGG
jgi:hypothetical protein